MSNTDRSPMFLITDDSYAPRGAIVRDAGRFIATDTVGKVLFTRQEFSGAIAACKKHGRMVCTGYYGIPEGTP